MDSNCPTVFYSHIFHAAQKCGKSCTKCLLISRSFLNEITTLIYQDVFALDFLAYAVIFGTHLSLFEVRKPHLKVIFILFWTENLT